MAKKEAPTGVKVISVLYYITAFAYGLLGLLLLFGSSIMGTIASQIPWLALISAGLFIVVGILLLGIAILIFFVGRNLWQLKSWARTVVLIFSGIGALSALIAVFQGDFGNIVSLGINIWIGYYLLKDKDAIKTFT